MVSKERAKLYRERVKTSKCRKIPKPSCVVKPSCKYASGKVRQFCRTKNNTRIPAHSRSQSRSQSQSRSFTTSTSGSYPALKIQELQHNKRKMQPVITRRKVVRNNQDLDDWGSSSQERMQPVVANRRGVYNKQDLNDW